MGWGVLADADAHARKRVDPQAFYTRPALVDGCVETICADERLAPHADETLVDFACGDNRFGARLRARAGVRVRAYDIAPSARAHDPEHVEQCDFLALTAEHVADVADRCVLGFNPPFGFRSARLRAFVEHGVALCRPRRIYLVHQRRLYCPRGYTTLYQRALPLRAFHVPPDDDANEGRVFPMYGCFFSVFGAAPSRPGHSGVRAVIGGVPPWLELDHMRARQAGDTFALLRSGSRAGAVCALLDGATARIVCVYDDGERTDALPGRASLDSNMYYKLRLEAARIRAYAPLSLERLARALSRSCARDRAKNASFPPFITRTHVIRCLEHAYVTRDAQKRKRSASDPFDGDIRDYRTV